MSSPSIPKKKKTRASPVYLEDEEWTDLDLMAHYSEVEFEIGGAPQSVSRNDAIVASLAWARKAFWKARGGRPKTEAELRESAKRYVEKLKRQREASGDGDDD